MNSIDPHLLEVEEAQRNFCAAYQQQQLSPREQSFPGAISRYDTSNNPPLGLSNGAPQYGMMPQNYGFDIHTNLFGNPPSALQAPPYVFGRWATDNGPYAIGDIVRQPQVNLFLQQLHQQSDYGPPAIYTNSYDGGYCIQHNSATPSINLSTNAHTRFQDSGHGWVEQDTSMNSFGTSISSNNPYTFAPAQIAQQSPQNFDPRPSATQEHSLYLPVPSSWTCSNCGHDSRTQSEHK